MRRNQAIWRRQAATQASLKLWQALSYFAMTPLAALNQSALCSPVAQQVEQAAVNRWVAGSNPARGAKFSKHLAKNLLALKVPGATSGATFCRFRERTDA